MKGLPNLMPCNTFRQQNPLKMNTIESAQTKYATKQLLIYKITPYTGKK
ncbi:hypothetical protein CLV42_11065 [Chitinophaga ginsengisoli]|uniref:Uncharacterized protein n=1 Tax=Chitinophaga ginsengisoli TaxID=363837 RepID=A0A2P8FYW6_9BACT|nr:hypothetical protein CLV42_11065 [Chitinophaga ginsengisoli]